MENKTFLEKITTENKESTKEVWPNPSCKKCYGRGYLNWTDGKTKEKGLVRCSCLGKGNQERAKKMYLKLMGNQNEKGFIIRTS